MSVVVGWCDELDSTGEVMSGCSCGLRGTARSKIGLNVSGGSWSKSGASPEPLVDLDTGSFTGPGCKTRPSKKWETAHNNGWNVSFGANTSVVRTGLLVSFDV